MKPILYNYSKSSCSWRVRIALALKNIDYEYKVVSLAEKQHKQPEFLKLNPMGKVPVLSIGNQHFSESLAIIEYLEEKFPEKRRLLPQNPECRAKVRGLSLLVAANVQPLQNPSVGVFHANGNQEEARKWCAHWIEQGFTALEHELKACSGKYSYGDNLTMLDTVLVPQVYNAREKFGVDMAPFPTITAIDERLSEVEAIRKAHPSAQSDT